MLDTRKNKKLSKNVTRKLRGGRKKKQFFIQS